MSTFGPAYDRNIDEPAIEDQRNNIKLLMINYSESWFTLSEIAAILHYPEASISAQLRHLRKDKFGGYDVQKRRRTGGGYRVWEYHLDPPKSKTEPDQMLLIPEPKSSMMGH